MEVTRRNFETMFPKILPLIEKASFISFDAEFSGLGRGKLKNKYNDLDTLSERYVKMRDSIVEYGLIQLGITLFRYSAEDDTFFTSTFSFLILGKNRSHYKIDTSSANFLAENSFDFNKLFLEGLSFLSINEEYTRREERAKKNLEDIPPSTPIRVRDEQAKSFVEESNDRIHQAIEKKEKSVVFSGKVMNAFYRKLLYNNVAPNFPNAVFRLMKGNDHDIEALIFDSILEKETFCGSSWEDNLNFEMGVGRLVKAILKANKPLVGHNVILDVLHFVDKFVISLPETFKEFQKVLRENLPDIYDTKLIAKDPPFNKRIINTALNPLYERLSNNCSELKLGVEEGFKSYTIANDDGQYHEAGFDAFMTGICFLIMAKVLEGKNFCKTSMMSSKKLSLYKNKINFMHSHDICYLDLHSPEVIPDRSNFVSIQCSSDFSSADCRTLLAGFSTYKLIWVNDNLFHVTFPEEEGKPRVETSEAIETLKTLVPPGAIVLSYEEHMRLAKSMLNCSASDLDSSVCSTEELEVANSNGVDRASAASVANSTNSSSSDNVSLRDVSASTNKVGKRRTIDEEDIADDSTGEKKALKRLKSVGSEQLSELTLESPSSERKSLVDKKENGNKKEEFSVPDEW